PSGSARGNPEPYRGAGERVRRRLRPACRAQGTLDASRVLLPVLSADLAAFRRQTASRRRRFRALVPSRRGRAPAASRAPSLSSWAAQLDRISPGWHRGRETGAIRRSFEVQCADAPRIGVRRALCVLHGTAARGRPHRSADGGRIGPVRTVFALRADLPRSEAPGLHGAHRRDHVPLGGPAAVSGPHRGVCRARVRRDEGAPSLCRRRDRPWHSRVVVTARRSPDANAERGGNPIHTADRGTVMARRWGPIRRPYTTSIVLVLLGVLVALEMLLRLRGRAAWHVPSVPSTEPA